MPWQFPDEPFGKAFVQNNPRAGSANSISALVASKNATTCSFFGVGKSSKNSTIVVAALDTTEEVTNRHASAVKNGNPPTYTQFCKLC